MYIILSIKSSLAKFYPRETSFINESLLSCVHIFIYIHNPYYFERHSFFMLSTGDTSQSCGIPIMSYVCAFLLFFSHMTFYIARSKIKKNCANNICITTFPLLEFDNILWCNISCVDFIHFIIRKKWCFISFLYNSWN